MQAYTCSITHWKYVSWIYNCAWSWVSFQYEKKDKKVMTWNELRKKKIMIVEYPDIRKLLQSISVITIGMEESMATCWLKDGFIVIK